MDFLDKDYLKSKYNNFDIKQNRNQNLCNNNIPVQSFIHHNNLIPEIRNQDFDDFNKSLNSFDNKSTNTRYEELKNEREQSNYLNFQKPGTINFNENLIPISARKENNNIQLNWQINQKNY